MKKQFLKMIVLFCSIMSLQSCQMIDAVIAQGEGQLTFSVKNNWDYAAKVTPPGMMKKVLKMMLEGDWIGDPNRFQALKIKEFGQQKPLYLIDPKIACPEDGCGSQSLWNIYHPACGATGWCSYFLYVEEEDGKYREVFDKHILRLGGDNFFKVSQQQKDGVPACLELIGFDYEAKEKGLINYEQEEEHIVSRYCYDGTEYTLNKLYKIPQSENHQNN